MSSVDASTLGQLAIRLGLIQEDQLFDGLNELGAKNAPSEQLVRVLERKGHLSSFQGAKLLKGDTDGYFLGGYRLLYRIAAGSFGRVYRADDPRSGSIVAIKVLRRRWSEDPHKVVLFEREGKVGLSLKHPNIVEILAVNRDAATGQYYIVMEFVEGGNLRDFLTIRKKLELPEALRILEETASGLALAFIRGLTHRDIKLTNILISAQGACKLVDFGLAELAGDENDEEATVDRTVDYAGLEKATGVKIGDARSDIYFLGCVFYELVMGKPMLVATKDRYQRMSRERFECHPQLLEAKKILPANVYRLLEKMVALDATARFQTPAQLMEAVRIVQRDLSGETSGPIAPSGPRTVFVVESNLKLQDVFREKLRGLGYRVLITVDPGKVVPQYQRQPFHALVVDVGSTADEGVAAFDRVRKEAALSGLYLGCVLILNEEQAYLASRYAGQAGVAALVRPVTLKQLATKLDELLPHEEAEVSE